MGPSAKVTAACKKPLLGEMPIGERLKLKEISDGIPDQKPVMHELIGHILSEKYDQVKSKTVIVFDCAICLNNFRMFGNGVGTNSSIEFSLTYDTVRRSEMGANSSI